MILWSKKTCTICVLFFFLIILSANASSNLKLLSEENISTSSTIQVSPKEHTNIIKCTVSLMTEIGKYFVILKDCFICVGVAFSIYLFRQKREKYPRANISHHVNTLQIDDNKTLLNIIVLMENIGDALININSARTSIAQILPAPDELIKNIDDISKVFEKDRKDIDWGKISGLGESILENRTIIEIEPGEKDEICFDFVIEKSVQVVHIYSYFKNDEKGKKNIGWHKNVVYNVCDDLIPISKREKEMPDNKNNDNSGNQKPITETPKPPREVIKKQGAERARQTNNTPSKEDKE